MSSVSLAGGRVVKVGLLLLSAVCNVLCKARARNTGDRADSARREAGGRAGRRRAPAALLMLAAALALLLAGDGGVAQAQTPEALVSNIGQPSLDADDVAVGTTNELAQSFRTGGARSGYELTSIVLRLETDSTTDLVPPTVTLRDSAEGYAVATFSAPASLTTGAGDYTYTLASAEELSGILEYWVVVEGGSPGVRWKSTAADAEDAGSAPGWTILNNGSSRTAGSSDSFTPLANALLLRVNGSTVPLALVSNITKDGTDVGALGTHDFAQQFTAGDFMAGYTLGSMAIRLKTDTTSATSTPTVTLHSDDTSAPGDKLADFSGPAVLTADTVANYAFTPTTAVTLARSTDYWVVVEGVTGVSVEFTEEDGEDVFGGTVGDAASSRLAASTGAFTVHDATDTPALKIRAEGVRSNVAASGTPLLKATNPDVFRVPLTLSADTLDVFDDNGNQTFDYTVTYNWQRFAADGTTLEADGIGTGPTYTLTSADVGKRVKVAVGFIDDDGYSEGPLTSDATSVIIAASSCPAPSYAGGATQLGPARTLTVGAHTSGAYGFSVGGQYGILSVDDRSFTTDASNTYTIQRISTQSNTLTLAFQPSPALSADDKRTLVLHICDQAYALVDAPETGSRQSFANSGQDWSGHVVRTIYISQDTVAPTFVDASVNGTSLMVTFSEPLGEAGSLANVAFTVKKGTGGAAQTLSGTPSISGRTVTLTLSTAIVGSDTDVKVAYTKQTGTANKVVDKFANEAATFGDQGVTNLLADTTPPTLNDAVLDADGLILTLTYSEALKTSSVPDKSVFTVERTPAGGSEETVNLAATNAVAVSGSVVTLKLATPIAHNDGSPKVSYTKPPSGSVIEDAIGNDAASFMDQAVTNNSTAPRVSITAVHADASPLFAHAEFTVTRSNTGTELDVAIAITQTDTYLDSTTQTITIPGGDTTATASFPSDYAGNTSGDLTATVAPSQSYAPGNAATVRMKVPASGKTVTYSHQQDAYMVTEGVASVPVAFTLRTGEGVAQPRQAISLVYVPRADTALRTTDYIGVVRATNIETRNWAADGTAFRATARDTIAIVDDSFHEGSEQFLLVDVRVDADGLVLDPAVFTPTCPPGIAVGDDCQATVTIVDNDTLAVQSVAVTSTPAGGYYGASDTISFTVTFNGAVTVTSTPQFTFELGGRSRQAAYASGSDSTDLVFSYTVATGDDDHDGISWGANALGLNGGAIKFMDIDLADQVDANLDHAAQAALPAHKVDTAKPLVVSRSADGTTLTLSFSEELNTTAPAATAFTVKVDGGAGVAPAGVSVSGSVVTLTLTLADAVTAGQMVTLTYAKPTTNKIRDLSGKEADAFTDEDVATAPPVEVEVSFALGSYRVDEGETVTVTVNLDVDPRRRVVIPIVATLQAGAGPTDYSFPSEVTFVSGETQQMLDFTATDDDVDDDDESVLLAFGALPIGVSGGARTETTVNITDNDDPEVDVSFGRPSYDVREDGMVTVTVELSADPERMVVIPLTATAQGGATAPGGTDPDYVAPPASVTFAGGQTSTTFDFIAEDDDIDDNDESVLLGFGTMPDSRVSAGTTATTTVSIVDDDGPGVNLSRLTLSVVQEQSGTYTVVLNTQPAGPVTVTPTSNNPLVTVSPVSLAFSPGGWNVARTVTVDAAAGSAEQTATISHMVSGYGTITTAPDVDVTVTAAVVVTPPGGGGGGGGPTPSEVDFEWTVSRDIEALDSGHSRPTGMWSDGATLSLLENGDGADDAVYAYDLESGERVEDAEFALADTNRAPRGIWFDGATVWVSDSGRDRLFAYDLATGTRDEERELELAERNHDARGIWSGGETMWVLDGGKNALFAYDLASAALLGEFELVSANGDPRGIWSDGVTVWVSDHGAKRLLAYRLPAAPDAPAAEDAEAVALERVRDEEFTELSGASNNSPRGIWSDGAVMYVADESDGKVYSYNMPDAIDARLASLTLSGVDIGEFGAHRTEYEGVPAEGVTQTTVEAEAAQRRARVVVDPADADADGHQVAVEGGSEVTVTVTSEDGTRTRVYRVRIRESEQEPVPASWPHCLRGDVAAGFSLVVYEGGGIEDLVACAGSRDIASLYALVDGEYVPYILGAPEFVNAAFRALFPDGVAAFTPLVGKSDGPASADPFPAATVTPDWSGCLRGDVAAGFSLVVYEGGGIEDLVACAASRDIASLYALVDGEYVPYILGAPEFVNAAFRALFPDGVPAATPFTVKRETRGP